MKLGGHQTFYPRPGWLTKGLLHLQQGGSGQFAQPEVADELGVGRNMSKSIGWWLFATGLVERTQARGSLLALTDFGRVIAERDPYMVQLGTWWLLHANAVAQSPGTSLPTFFSTDRPRRFDRATLAEHLVRKQIQDGKRPSLRSVQREVSTILQTYAVPIPRPSIDPEDNLGSPFQRISLFRHIRSTGYFEVTQPVPTPPEVLGLVLTSLDSLGAVSENPSSRTVSSSSNCLVRAAAILGQPRKDLLYLAELGEKSLGPDRMAVGFLAGERSVTVRNMASSIWARLYYERLRLEPQRLAA